LAAGVPPQTPGRFTAGKGKERRKGLGGVRQRRG